MKVGGKIEGRKIFSNDKIEAAIGVDSFSIDILSFVFLRVVSLTATVHENQILVRGRVVQKNSDW